ncbi:Fur family transcriptional regulator [Altericroceibacterium xinjiangense]|uniref:Fur family transcriptional regulator n=1 Tax=Altericroceibacterium xinjiangense TaxID=762261 RepID=UPI000F7EB34C|nr:transcriptional repressor [Altericroceibacterium xinjiangense]
MAASSHTHLALDDAALITAARDAMVLDGEQWTAMREKVFKALAAAAQPVSAYDVAERLSASEGRRVAPNSVYRILDLFVAHNLALRVESRNAYLANVHPGCVHDCIFLICEQCGDTAHLDDDETARMVRRSATTDGFAVTRPIMEIVGRCRNCAT